MIARGARLIGSAVLCALSWLLTSVAQACPVCFSAKDEAQRQAFFDTTIFLTLLPLTLIGGFIYWVARRLRRLEAEQRAHDARDVEPGPAGR